jgi:hypothetical protein
MRLARMSFLSTYLAAVGVKESYIFLCASYLPLSGIL